MADGHSRSSATAGDRVGPERRRPGRLVLGARDHVGQSTVGDRVGRLGRRDPAPARVHLGSPALLPRGLWTVGPGRVRPQVVARRRLESRRAGVRCVHDSGQGHRPVISHSRWLLLFQKLCNSLLSFLCTLFSNALRNRSWSPCPAREKPRLPPEDEGDGGGRARAARALT